MNTIMTDTCGVRHSLFEEPLDFAVKPFSRGKRATDPGNPWATWSIVQRPAIGDLADSLGIEWPDAAEGYARVCVGSYRVDDDSQRVLYHSFFPNGWRETNELIETIERIRDEGTICEAGEWIFMLVPVRKCVTAGCDLFGGWHNKSDRCSALDHSRDGYTCRLESRHGIWVPRVELHNRNANAVMVASFRNDAQWLLTEYRRFLATWVEKTAA